MSAPDLRDDESNLAYQLNAHAYPIVEFLVRLKYAHDVRG